MKDIVRLLPDSVANQIAAGEVVQRPASVVKELIENSVDAGATSIQIILKNFGKTLIQVIDNGKGMSPMDARMSFERHATSKIASADDLFNIHTLGFRGEALPSIASVAEVEMKSRREEDELGTLIRIVASELKEQEEIATSKGTNISVKNLFFNIPVRRKFLKSDTTELRNITNEFLRVALTYPDIAFSLSNNGTELYNLSKNNLRQRIVNIFGKNINSKLISIDSVTELITIKGFICHPQFAKKTYGEQYFFVNNRFMKHNFFHKAIMEAFSGLIAADAIPSYFLYFTVDPKMIDVNIHPTKTEIKFENERDFFQILLSVVKEALGKYNVMPSIDFDRDGDFGYVETSDNPNYSPKVDVNRNYTPFNYSTGISYRDSGFEHPKPDKVPANWESLFEGLTEKQESEQLVMPEMLASNSPFLQLRGKYIVTPVHSGLMFINQKRAHERILFEQYLKNLTDQKIGGQKCMFPETVELSPDDFSLVQELRDDLEFLGFELSEFGKSCFAIYSTPPNFSYSKAKDILVHLIDYYKTTEGNIRTEMKARLALSLAKAAAIPYGYVLDIKAMSEMVDDLFACQNHNFTEDGKAILYILKFEDINTWF
ncbi:MAG: DNA mismatch repair endonuclease MutL [Culturomica sp.]|jgi:DNA mismatch repair protein MutL|nr:DNA mismatch repair endonuclease MutL [Culturomica sp.]